MRTHPTVDADNLAAEAAANVPSSLQRTAIAPFALQRRYWQRLYSVMQRHYYRPDMMAARILYSAVAAHRFSGSPVWVMLVAPPGSIKTELLTALEGMALVHIIDEITPNTFISGQMNISKSPQLQKTRPSSLLHRIGASGIIAYPDFSTVIEMRPDNRGAILSQMRRIFDGSFRREFGHTSGDKREWKGHITFLAAVTPDIDRHYSIFQALGERFIQTRIARPAGVDAAIKAMQQMENRPAVVKELHDAVHDLFGHLLDYEPVLPMPIMRKIASLAEFVVLARTHVARAGYNREMLYTPEGEAPTRLSQQLSQLVKGSALLAGRWEVNASDYLLALRAGLDSIPSTRRTILSALWHGRRLDHAKLKLATTTIDRTLEDLQSLDLVVKKSETLTRYAGQIMLDAHPATP